MCMRLADVDADVRAIADRMSRRLLTQGAKATLLTGSHARGRARADSDIDLFAVGDGPRERVEVVDGRTVSVHWFTSEEARQRLSSPETAYIAAFGWGDALIIADPLGVAKELQDEARTWTWDKMSAEADAFIVNELVGWAEYIRKLVDALASNRELDATALTAESALRLGRLVAIRSRVTSQSENGLWPAIVDAAPSDWAQALECALRSEGQDLRTAALGALRLYENIAKDVNELLDENERATVAQALAAVRRLP